MCPPSLPPLPPCPCQVGVRDKASLPLARLLALAGAEGGSVGGATATVTAAATATEQLDDDDERCPAGDLDLDLDPLRQFNGAAGDLDLDPQHFGGAVIDLDIDPQQFGGEAGDPDLDLDPQQFDGAAKDLDLDHQLGRDAVAEESGWAEVQQQQAGPSTPRPPPHAHGGPDAAGPSCPWGGVMMEVAGLDGGWVSRRSGEDGGVGFTDRARACWGASSRGGGPDAALAPDHRSGPGASHAPQDPAADLGVVVMDLDDIMDPDSDPDVVVVDDVVDPDPIVDPDPENSRAARERELGQLQPPSIPFKRCRAVAEEAVETARGGCSTSAAAVAAGGAGRGASCSTSAAAAGGVGGGAGCSTSAAAAAVGGVGGGAGCSASLEANGSGRGSGATWACRCCTYAGNKKALLRCEVCNGLRQDGSGSGWGVGQGLGGRQRGGEAAAAWAWGGRGRGRDKGRGAGGVKHQQQQALRQLTLGQALGQSR